MSEVVNRVQAMKHERQQWSRTWWAQSAIAIAWGVAAVVMIVGQPIGPLSIAIGLIDAALAVLAVSVSRDDLRRLKRARHQRNYGPPIERIP